MLDIFVSRPTRVTPAYEAGLKTFLSLLEPMELRPRTVGATDFPTKSPLDEVIDVMRSCDGAVVLGYPQILVERGKIRDSDCTGLTLATEWNHIEAALAYAQQLPLFLVHQTGVDRGVFDRGAMAGFVHDVDLANAAWALETSTHGALVKWKRDCVMRAGLRAKTAAGSGPAV
jgi:hypothetical protein